MTEREELYNDLHGNLEEAEGSYRNRAKDRADAAIELIRIGSYDAAIIALADAKTLSEIADECDTQMQMLEVNYASN